MRGACYYTTAESGTNECRWKINNGCVWAAESGTNQCKPEDYAASTLTASNGTVTFRSMPDGDGRPETILGDVIVKYTKTGDVVTTRVHLRVSVASAELLSATVTGLQSSPLTVIRGDPAFPWTVERGSVLNAQGAKVPAWGYRPRADYFLLGTEPPAGYPPGGYNCGVAYQGFIGAQLDCFGGWAGQAIEGAFTTAMDATYHAGVGCVSFGVKVGLASGGVLGLAALGQCLGGASATAFAYGVVDQVYLGYAGGYNSWVNQACNAINQARYTAASNCQTFIPPLPGL